jgi:hypothetical protein
MSADVILAAVTEVAAFFLPVLPLLGLVLCLLFGRYPGHEVVMRLSERIAARSRRRRDRGGVPRTSWPERRAAHGGLLLAHALSGRAPPA